MLLTDSMAVTTNQFGMPSPLPGRRKNFWLRPARTVAIVSGTATEELFEARPETRFEDAVSALFDDLIEYEGRWLAQFQPAVAKYLAGGDDPELQDFPQLLAGGGQPGEPPQLAVIKPSGSQWASNGTSALYAVGCWTYEWLEPAGRMSTSVPTTLDGCKRLAIGWAREFIQYGRAQLPPDSLLSVGYPLYLTTFDAHGNCQEEEIQE